MDEEEFRYKVNHIDFSKSTTCQTQFIFSMSKKDDDNPLEELQKQLKDLLKDIGHPMLPRLSFFCVSTV